MAEGASNTGEDVGRAVEPLERITMGHEGQRTSGGQASASFTGRDSSGAKHSYRMPYGSWVSADRPTIITVTITEGLPSGG